MTFIPPIALLPKLNQSVIFDSNLLYQVKALIVPAFRSPLGCSVMIQIPSPTSAGKSLVLIMALITYPCTGLTNFMTIHIIDLGRLYLLSINNLHTIKLNKSSFRKCYDQLSRTCPIH